MLRVFGINAVQLKVSGGFTELHVEPAMCMAFPEIVADGRLVNEVKMALLIMLPLMGMTVEIGSGVFPFGKQFQQSGPVAHAIDGTHAPIGIGVEVA